MFSEEESYKPKPRSDAWRNAHIRPWTREKTERRERIIAHFHRTHELEHARANSLTPCRFCHKWPAPKPREAIMPMPKKNEPEYTMPEMEAMSDAVETLSIGFGEFKSDEAQAK